MTAGLPYLRRRRLRLAALVLPALVFRALVPFGFMPVVEGGGVTIGFCPGEASLPPGIAAAHHLHHHHTANGTAPGNPADPGAATHHAPCLFAASAAPAFAPALLALPPALTPPARIDASAAPRVVLPSIVRAQAARAPPSFA